MKIEIKPFTDQIRFIPQMIYGPLKKTLMPGEFRRISSWSCNRALAGKSKRLAVSKFFYP